MKTLLQIIAFSLKMGLFALVSSCGQKHFTSQGSTVSLKPSSNSASVVPVLDKTQSELTEALAALDKAPLVNESHLQNSKYIFLGYSETMNTTDGKGLQVKSVPSTEMNIQFSTIQQDQCPKGTYCITALRPYLNTRISSQCGITDYSSTFNQIFSTDGLLIKNLLMNKQLSTENSSCSEVDSALWAKLKSFHQLEFGFTSATEKYLSLKFYGANYIFKKVNQ